MHNWVSQRRPQDRQVVGTEVNVFQIIMNDSHVNGISRAVGAWGLGVDPGAFATMLFRLLSHWDCRDFLRTVVYDDGLILPDGSNSRDAKRQLVSHESTGALENKRLNSAAALLKGGEINTFLTLQMPENDGSAIT